MIGATRLCGLTPQADSAEPRNPTQRRREQVRRAQKTHRERKEAYVASLESEVVRLRANEARLESETKALYAENNVLRKLLTQQGIRLPAETVPGSHVTNNTGYSSTTSPGYSSTSFSDEATDSTLTLSITQEDPGAKRKNRRKQIYIQQQQQQSQASPRPNQSSGAINFSQPITPPLSGSATSHFAAPSNPTLLPTATLSALDHEALGMDFVLTLESPCLSHIDVATNSSQPHSHSTPGTALTTTTGHALTLSACLLHTHPSPAGQRLDSSAAWPVPRANLSQLLALSAQIPLADDEVTPIQAWEFVRRHEGFGGLDLARWEALKEKLVAAVRCYGFGGVVGRDVLENSVFEAFVVGRVF
ncbi:hypothetical protein yc1106_06169 [Curvularia clavata]|uniref:BZIP domain-containing protein n=1 Tax=Curvularia clavata TaxID=95742 RepID=A0A9Q9DUE4_CURCL|nr:hypothetical protein yc1106_06169 [Curvularia clavata]